MNFWRYLCDHARGMVKGEQFYRQSEDAGKAIAPALASPAVQAILTKSGLPTTAQNVLSVLASKAASPSPLPTADAQAARVFIQAHLPPP